MPYDEVKYWNERNNPNAQNPDTEGHIQYVKDNLEGCHNILDFGCGVGRIFPAYENIDTVEGYDISELYKSRLIKESKKHGFIFNLTTVNEILHKMPYNDNEFECSVAVSVLLHQRPEYILYIMHELARISNKVIIISWFDPTVKYNDHNNETGSDNYCYHYDYYKICYEQNWEMENILLDDRLIYFCMVK